MDHLLNLPSALAVQVGGMIRQVVDAHPGMLEVALMVYVGDVYAMREQLELSRTGTGSQGYQPERK